MDGLRTAMQSTLAVIYSAAATRLRFCSDQTSLCLLQCHCPRRLGSAIKCILLSLDYLSAASAGRFSCFGGQNYGGKRATRPIYTFTRRLVLTRVLQLSPTTCNASTTSPCSSESDGGKHDSMRRPAPAACWVHRAHLVGVLALDPQGGRIVPGAGRRGLVDVKDSKVFVAALLVPVSRQGPEWRSRLFTLPTLILM
jgi:hypothetical protein